MNKNTKIRNLAAKYDINKRETQFKYKKANIIKESYLELGK